MPIDAAFLSRDSKDALWAKPAKGPGWLGQLEWLAQRSFASDRPQDRGGPSADKRELKVLAKHYGIYQKTVANGTPYFGWRHADRLSTHSEKVVRLCGMAPVTAVKAHTIFNYPKSCGVCENATGVSACAAPLPRSGGCVRGSPRIAGQLPPACGRYSCRSRSACATRAPRVASRKRARASLSREGWIGSRHQSAGSRSYLR